MMADSTKQTGDQNTAGNAVNISAHCVVNFSQPVADFSNSVVNVYDGFHSALDRDVLVYMAQASALPRLNRVTNYKYAAHLNLMNLREYTFARHPGTGKEYAAIVYDSVQGAPLLKDWQGTLPEISHQLILDKIVKPVLDIMMNFQNQDFVHGNINLRNMFWSAPEPENIDPAEDEYNLILGECLSTAASFQTHVLYETLNRSLGDDKARGTGSIKDDLYALGVCAAMLAWQYNPASSLSESEIISEKIEKGTFGMLARPEKVSGELLEFLRGVLNDSEADRWGLEDIAMWLDGQRLSPRQPALSPKAARPIVYKDREFIYLKKFVREISAAPIEEAAKFLKSSVFLKWFMNNFHDKSLLANLEVVLEANKTPLKNEKDMQIFVTQILAAVDPEGPIHFKNKNIKLRGFGKLLAFEMSQDRDLSDYLQFINQQVYAIWLRMQENVPPDAPVIASAFEAAKKYINKKMPSMGIERVVYTMSEDACCFSPEFKNDFVFNPKQLVLNLEKNATIGKLSTPLLDRNMIAFLSVRAPKYIEKHMSMVNAPDSASQNLGALKVVTAIAIKEGAGPLPKLGDYFIDRADDILKNLKNTKLREKLAKEIERMRGTGDMAGILLILSDDQVIQADAQKFQNAKQEYIELENRKQNISGSAERKKLHGAHKGRQVAMLMASVLASIGILVNIINFFTG